MKISELTTGQFTNFFEESTLLLNHDVPGSFDRLNVMSHPEKGDVLLFQVGDKALLIEASAPGEGIHDHARAVAALNFR